MSHSYWTGALRRRQQTTRWIGCATLALALAGGIVSNSAASPIVLQDNNSSLTINPTTPSGAFDWLVDGVNQLKRQGFFYRVGTSGPEQALDTLTQGPMGATDTNFDGQFDTFFVRYLGSGFNIELTYTLSGGLSGSQASNLSEQIKINNTSGSALNIDLFKYSDYDLDGSAFGDTVEFVNANTIHQRDGQSFMESVTTPSALNREASLDGSTLFKLIDPFNPDNLSNTPSVGAPVFGPSDVVWALQWSEKVDPNSSFILGISNSVMVPEPASIALALMGMATCVVFRRRCRRQS